MRILTNKEHAAIIAAHTFLQNLYLYGGSTTVMAELYRTHLICDTVLVPHLVLPYLERCVHHAQVLHRRHLASKDALKILGPECASIVDDVTARDMDDPALNSRHRRDVTDLGHCDVPHAAHAGHVPDFAKVQSTSALMEMKTFVARHGYVFVLITAEREHGFLRCREKRWRRMWKMSTRALPYSK